MSAAEQLHDITHRNVVFVSGKGGVGKTAISRALALALAREGKRTLWVTFEDPLRPPGDLIQEGPNLWNLNCEASTAFEEYAGMKIGVNSLTRLFVHNKLIRYLAKAAPGIHELVLIGKIWNDRLNYDHVIADMPSTGYGLAMFHSVQNFSRLFQGGPLYRDAEAMLSTFRNPRECGHLIVALPEEMPLQESIELDEHLRAIFPQNRAGFIVNRCFPHAGRAGSQAEKPRWENPLPKDSDDYIRKRAELEDYNLKLWHDRGIEYGELGYIPPSPRDSMSTVIRALSEELQAKRYV